MAYGDFAAPARSATIIADAMASVGEVLASYKEGLISDGERYNKTVDLWSDAAEGTRMAARALASACDPLTALAAAGSDEPSPERVRGIRGLLAEPSGQVIESPVLHTPGEGLTAHELFMTSRATRGDKIHQGWSRRWDRRSQLVARCSSAESGEGTVT